MIPLGTVVGGSGGGISTDTNGGGPGDVALGWPALGGSIRTASPNGSQPGADGGDAPKSAAPGTRAAYGCGGAGGGGGAPGGRGGNGSPGGNGLIEIWW